MPSGAAFLNAFAANGGAAALAAGAGPLVLPAQAQTALAGRERPNHHFLPATARTVHWGYFSKPLKPLVEIELGDLVTIEVLTHHANDDADRMIKGIRAPKVCIQWTKDRKGSSAAAPVPWTASR